MPSFGDLRAAVASAPTSAVLIGLNLALFLAVTLDGRLLDAVALPPDWSGLLAQPWTAVTVFFTAEMLIHVVAAVLVIAVFGARFERVAGSGHVLGVYLLAGLAGSLALVATAMVTGFDEPSKGASAAFLGLLGALAASPRETWGRRLEQLDKLVVVLVLAQLAPVVGIGDWVSSTAHLAGLGIGAAYGYLVRPTITDQQIGTPTVAGGR
jgi:membrane associated rhomboid family serine protease